MLPKDCAVYGCIDREFVIQRARLQDMLAAHPCHETLLPAASKTDYNIQNMKCFGEQPQQREAMSSTSTAGKL